MLPNCWSVYTIGVSVSAVNWYRYHYRIKKFGVSAYESGPVSRNKVHFFDAEECMWCEDDCCDQ